MSNKTEIPGFDSEAEEAEWWYANRGWITEQFQAAARSGALKRGSTVLERVRGPKPRALTIELPPEMLAKIHDLAIERGMDEAGCAKELLLQALAAR
jgi:hypothetical protein